jgi:serine/threonine-protein kinase
VNRVGRYEITEPLGQGGMGTVYKAYDPLLARVVAVKVISAQFSTQPDLRERFFREARAVARLDHPNIVTVYDLGEEDGVPYLAMQFLEGRDLEHRMRSPEGTSPSRLPAASSTHTPPASSIAT